MKRKIVLAYSGGLDTSVAIKWLQDRYNADVVCVAGDVGESRDYEMIRQKALKLGALSAYTIDGKEEFIRDYAFQALKANALYENTYPLATALARPLIAAKLVDIAAKEGADAVAHGCTAKGNDQVRFDVSIRALNPSLEIIAPMRDWPMSREEEIEYARQHDIPVPVNIDKPYSTDINLWGRSIECGVLEDPWNEPPADIYELTVSPQDAPDKPAYAEVEFERGVPVRLNGEALAPVALVEKLNSLAGANGVGRIDMVENRLVGIKSREIYECPAATVLLKAHADLESLVLPRETAHFKKMIEQKFSELVYFGLWFSQLREALSAFIDKTQEVVSGTVRIKFFKGTCTVAGRKSPHSLYQHDLATYEKGDRFSHNAAAGFIELWGLQSQIFAEINRK